MGEPNNGEKRDAFEAGKRQAHIESLQRSLDELRKSLEDHRAEERDTWEKFEKKLEGLDRTINDLTLWRAKVMSMAGVIAFVVTSVWHFVLMSLKGR